MIFIIKSQENHKQEWICWIKSKWVNSIYEKLKLTLNKIKQIWKYLPWMEKHKKIFHFIYLVVLQREENNWERTIIHHQKKVQVMTMIEIIQLIASLCLFGKLLFYFFVGWDYSFTIKALVNKNEVNLIKMTSIFEVYLVKLQR